MQFTTSIVAALAVATSSIVDAASVVSKRASASTTVSVSGNMFMQGSNRFYIRGVDYQPGGSSKLVDPLADSSASTCQRDIQYFTQLGINTIRVYSVDNSQGHDTCMNALEAAGIYLILDVNTPAYSINRIAPAESYNPTYLQSIFATIDAFQKYPNTLAFFSGNEVINETTASTITAPYVKAVGRDMKAYMAARNYRAIPVGYSAADVTTNRYQTALFMNCGPNNERSDFFAFNDYSWCDPSSYQQSGWAAKVAMFANYSLPLFLSEYGCNTNTRSFQEVASLYGPNMTPVYSGGLVYEYSQEVSNYGLVTINGNSVSIRPDFTALQTAYAGTPNPSGNGGGRTNSGGANACPMASSTWIWGNDSLPVMPDGAQKYFTSGAGTGPGLSGSGSQTAGGASTQFAVNGTDVTSGSGSTTSSSPSGSASSGTASGTTGGKSAGSTLETPGFVAVLATVFAVLSRLL